MYKLKNLFTPNYNNLCKQIYFFYKQPNILCFMY